MERPGGMRELIRKAYRAFNPDTSLGKPDKTLAEQYEDHSWMLKQLERAQKADSDMRDNAREASAFLTARHGMWEDEWFQEMDGRPRYTFDLTTPVVDQVDRTMARNDYVTHVHPAGGEGTKDIAATYEGIIRHIENISRGKIVYTRADRGMVRKGLDGIEVVQDYVDGDAFEQDLMVKHIPNWLDTVWLGPHKEPDGSDCKYAWKLVGIPEEEYKAKYPDRDGVSVGSDRAGHSFYPREDQVAVGLFYYLLPVEREIVKMSDGEIYEADQLAKTVEGQEISVLDELAAAGIVEVGRRKRTTHKLCIRKFDLTGWIDEKHKETVFNYVTLVPRYANFSYEEDKPIWFGAVEKLMDPQRNFNYLKSREMEEGALAPRKKLLATKAMAKGLTRHWARLNTSSEPVLWFNPDPKAPDGKPVETGGAKINEGLKVLSDDMANIIDRSAGIFSANRGDDAGFEQSGVAIEALQDRGDAGANKYIAAREVAQAPIGRILVKAIPKVYQPGRQVRILGEDGSEEFQTLGIQVQDQQTGQMVLLNELEQGTYDVTCTSGPSFQSRSSETATAIKEIGTIDPTFIEQNGDILANSVNSPGMKQVAERKRRELFLKDMIPDDQLTDEEKAQKRQQGLINGTIPPETPEEAKLVQWAQSQPKPEDPMMVAAQAEAEKAAADRI